MTDLFANTGSDQNQIDPNKIYEDLVGEGKKFQTPQELARGKFEADAFIERIKQENAQLREELNARVRLEEVIDRLSTPQTQNAPVSTPNNQQGEQGNNQSALTPEQLAELIDKRVNEREQNRTREQNINSVREALTAQFGSDYVSHLNRTAAELGFSQDQVREMAATAPKALLKLVGAQERPQAADPFAPPRSSVQTPLRGTDTGVKNKAFYDQLKKTDPTRYWSPAVQNEMHREAIRLGERFFT